MYVCIRTAGARHVTLIEDSNEVEKVKVELVEVLRHFCVDCVIKRPVLLRNSNANRFQGNDLAFERWSWRIRTHAFGERGSGMMTSLTGQRSLLQARVDATHSLWQTVELGMLSARVNTPRRDVTVTEVTTRRRCDVIVRISTAKPQAANGPISCERLCSIRR